MILISRVGLLLLTITNRLGRAIDRARQLKHELSVRTRHERAQTFLQVTILYRRAKIIRLSITLAATSADCPLGFAPLLAEIPQCAFPRFRLACETRRVRRVRLYDFLGFYCAAAKRKQTKRREQVIRGVIL